MRAPHGAELDFATGKLSFISIAAVLMARGGAWGRHLAGRFLWLDTSRIAAAKRREVLASLFCPMI